MRPVSATLTSRAPLPEPALRAVVVEPYAVVCPSSTTHVVARPRGSMVPLAVAVVGVMAEAAPVTTAGGAVVRNVASAPVVVPELFTPTTR